jgi:glutathione synthase/RimK-type ligase-like ATP-grasp enzyme
LREQQYQSVTFSFFDQLMRSGKLVVNPFTGAYLDHDAKAQRHEKFRALGLAAPRTLTTNDPERALSFLKEVGQAVAKPAIGVGLTRKVLEGDLERLQEFTVCPVLLQELLIGDTLRVHIVGDSVVLALAPR